MLPYQISVAMAFDFWRLFYNLIILLTIIAAVFYLQTCYLHSMHLKLPTLSVDVIE